MLKVTGQVLRALSPSQFSRQCHTQKVKNKPGSCGIPPFIDPLKKAKASINAPEQIRFKLPDHLIRPPCMPTSGHGKEQACLLDAVGMFCPVDRLQYKYPPFSDNMDEIRGDGKVCWWTQSRPCDLPHKDEATSRTRPDVRIIK